MAIENDVSSAHTGLETLLDLANEFYAQDGGYWVKVEAWRIAPSPGVPHGIRYALTLHSPDGARVLGFDNAHAVPSGTGRYAARCVEYDHWHPEGKGARPYEFQHPAQLLKDFFAEVDRVLKARGVIKS